MKPLRLRSLGTAAFLLAAASTAQAAINLEATILFTASGECDGSAPSSGVPVLVTALPGTTCTADTTCAEAPGGSSLYPRIDCFTTDGTKEGAFIKTDLPQLFSSDPYVVVEKYTTGGTCDPAEIASITAYLADGKCHKTDTAKSYAATRASDGSAVIKTYGDTACATTATTMTVTAAQATGNSCTDGTTGISNTKIYGGGRTPSIFVSQLSYSSSTGACTSPAAVPTKVVTTVLDVSGASSCLASNGCTGVAEPYMGATCTSVLTYKEDMAVDFGSNPYVIVEKYTSGGSCAALSDMTTYLADAKCHKTGIAESYRATRATDGSAVIKTYTDSATCATTGTTLTVSATQASGNSCAAGANGIPDTKVYGGGATPLYLQSTMSFSSSTDSCKSPAVPTNVATAVVLVDACAASLTCTGSVEPFVGTACSSTLTYKADMAATFGSNPYVIVEKYTSGGSCAATALTGITTYLADGKCHKTGATASYAATRASDGSAVVKTYADSATCATTGTTLIVTAAQATGNSCTDGTTGISNTKIYGSSTSTPSVFKSTLSYSTNAASCISPAAVPTKVATTVVGVGACAASVACTGLAEPYTGTTCTSLIAYKEDMAAAFGSNPYVVIEKYTAGGFCAASALSDITTYLADGKCHKTGATASYAATRASDGSAVIKTYADSATCATTGTTTTVTVAQATGNSCANDGSGISDTKIYGGGRTPSIFVSSLSYSSSTGACTSPAAVPTKVVTTILDLTSGGTCSASTSCTGGAEPYMGATCTSVLTYKEDMAVDFGSNPYVIVEKYTSGGSCAALSDMTTYLADAKCHKTGIAESYRATRATDGSAVIKTYTDSATCATTGTTLTVSATQASGNSCAAGANGIPDTKVYGGGATPLYLQSTMSFSSSTDSCKSPAVPTNVATAVVLVDACAASLTCTGSVEPFVGTACSSTLTYKADMAATFGSNPYVIVEKYTSGGSCAATALTGITTYLADGKCHKTGATASYAATRASDGSAVVKTYADSATCATTGTTLIVTAAQATGNSCTDGTTGISNTKIYGSSTSTPSVFKSTLSYSTNAASCISPAAVPTKVATTVVGVGACAASVACTGLAEPYTGTTCTSLIAYKEDMAAAFGSNPYVVIEKYTAGGFCAASALSDITTYLADGKCHKTGATASYAATRASDGSAVIKTYADSATCATTGTTTTVTVAQATGNSCANDGSGILNTKIYGSGNTKLVFKSTLTYSSYMENCKSPGVPIKVATTVQDLTLGSCAASTGCTVLDVFLGASCTSVLTYKEDMAAAFGSNPYVIVEKYTSGGSCVASTLSGITTYLADGKCHKTGIAESYRATRAADGSAEIKTFTDATCVTADTTTTVTAAQASGNSCAADTTGLLNTKVYGGGATPLYLESTVSYSSDTGSCKSPAVPTNVATAVVLVDVCTASTACFGSSEPYVGTACSSTLSYKADMAATFGSNPYVIVEKYTTGLVCDATALSGIDSYLADGKCHKTGATASYRATRKADGSATVKTYTDSPACGTAGTTLAVTVAQATGNTCAAGADGIADTKVYGNGETPMFYLSSSLTYSTDVGSCKSPAIPVLAVTSLDLVDACTATTACTGTSEPYVGTACSSTIAFKADMAATFGSNPYIIMEKYTSGGSCAASTLSGMTTYLADGKCHKTGATASYRATRAADGSAEIKTYTDSMACATTGTTVTVSAAQASGNSCTAGTTGLLNTKVYGGGATPLYLQSTVSYSSNTNSCKSPGVPTKMATVVLAFDTCTATTGCSGSAEPYEATACSTHSSYKMDVQKAFGSNPYLIIKKYRSGSTCAASTLSAITTYLADGKCHKTGGTESYAATRAADGSAVVKTYADSATCATAATTMTVSAAQATGNSCTDGETGISNTKIYGGGSTQSVYKSTLSYSSKTDNCMSPRVPTKVVTTAVAIDACTATTGCTGSVEPFTGTACSSVLAYKADMAAAFGSNPYVIVEKYTTGGSCAASALSGMTTYLADGKCYKTGATASYRATRATDGLAEIKVFTDATCVTAGTTTTVTAAQATGNSCANDVNGILDTKVYGGGVTPLYLKSTVSYSSNTNSCKSPGVPTKMATTVVAIDACTATTACTGSNEPFEGTACSSTLAYKADMAAAFGVNPYVIVEKYTTGGSCAASALSGITTYLADGKCHKTGVAESYRATRAVDGSAVIKTFTDATCFAAADTTTTVTADQASGNSCAAGATGLLNTKVYGGGATPLYLQSTMSFSSNTDSCKSPGVPTKVATTVVLVDACTATTVCTGSVEPFEVTACSSTLAYKADMASAFGSNPYVIVEKYTTGGSCAASTLSGITTYLADGKCHKTGATASYVATRALDGSAVIKTYADSATCATAATTLTVSAAQATGNSCSDGATGISNTKIYGGGSTPLVTKSTLSFSSNAGSCKLPGVPTRIVTTVVDSGACAASSTCTGSAEPFTGTTCTSAVTTHEDIAAAFGSNPYVIVEKYTTGGSCAASALSGMTTYLADGKCYKTGATASYRATRATDGLAEIKVFTDATCVTAGTTTTVTAAQATGNSCANDVNGILDTKVYGGGVTPLYLKSTVSYSSNTNSCKSPGVPTKMATTVVAIDACTATTACTGSNEPFEGTACSSTLAYKADMAAAFGVNPYVIVEKYTTGGSCAASALSGITTYLADGKCHKTGATASYVATRAADGSAEIKTYTDSSACATTGTTSAVSASQATGNSCANDVNGIANTKVYGGGATPVVWSTVAVSGQSSCALPSQASFTSAYTCTATPGCLVFGERSITYSCSSDYFAAANSLFVTKPYVVLELYNDANCAAKDGVMALSADQSCYLAMDAASSFTFTLGTDGSGTMVMYEDKECSDATPVTTSLTGAQLSAHQCVGSTKFYAFNAPAPPTPAPPTPAPTPAPTADPTAAPTPAPTDAAPAGSGSANTGGGSGASLTAAPSLLTTGLLLGWVAGLLL